MEPKEKTWDELSEEIRDELFKRHTHAELVFDQSQIVYHEQDVLEIMQKYADEQTAQLREALKHALEYLGEGYELLSDEELSTIREELMKFRENARKLLTNQPNDNTQ